MNFASYDFWSLLILCFVVSQLLMALTKAVSLSYENLAGKICLAATGLILLGSESWLTLGAFLWVVSLSWIGVLFASQPQFNKKSLLSRLIFIVLLIGQLAPLFYYKYWTFVLNDWLKLNVAQPSVLIPMGLSFYTFQKIGFWIDTINNPGLRPKFLDYLNFCSFFPQIVGGPIEKRQTLLPQIQSFRFKIRIENLEPALRWIILGLAYKLIVADNLGVLSNDFKLSVLNPWHIWLECFVFGLRIYFDFAGYSFIALGLGLLFGVQLSLNFRCPYWSLNLRDFWRNWHVTLGIWLRDYIYLPLGGKRVKWWIVNTIIVFLVSGIWHGAGWGFLIWGLLHGVGVAFCGISPGFIRFAPLQWAFTFTYTTATWLFFLERDTVRLFQKAIILITPAAYSLENLRLLTSAFPGATSTITTTLILSLALTALVLEGLGVRFKSEPYHLARHPAVCILLVFLTILLAPMEESQFIYFNF